ncbi:tyrosine-type recombinase/integrase [candidate division KSB1 bacterium]
MKYLKPIKDNKILKRIAQNLKRNGEIRNYLLYVMGINCGLRSCDLLKLKVRDVFKNEQPVDEFRIIQQKTNRPHYVFINGDMKKALKYWHKNTKDKSPDSYIFKSKRSDKAITGTIVHGLINRWVTEPNVALDQDVGCHTLRKSFAFALYERGAPLEVIAEALGHKNIAHIITYIGIDSKNVRDHVNGLNLV